MSVPAKYLQIGDFHAYYSGALKAPYLTIFTGGNHEASNYLSELFYGGWVAPNIYYLGAANVIRCGPLRIAGMSGIWKGYNYRKPHHERIPYSQDDVKSVYHVREIDVRRLMQIKTQVDIGLSHDWPHGVEWMGDWRRLFRCKKGFEEDSRAGQLGSKAAKYIMDRLRPKYWFAAHLHVKFAAFVKHDKGVSAGTGDSSKGNGAGPSVDAHPRSHSKINGDRSEVLGTSAKSPTAVQNDDEIDLGMDDDEDVTEKGEGTAAATEDDPRALLPESFSRPQTLQKAKEEPAHPDGITNTTTQFLALDKCLPNRHFLQMLEMKPHGDAEDLQSHTSLAYDKEWLAISRVFASDLTFGNPTASVPQDKGETQYASEIAAQEAWVEENLVQKNLMTIPENFSMTAPPFDGARGIGSRQQPKEYTNPQTTVYCKMLDIPIPFDASEEEREERRRRGPLGGGHNSYRGQGRGRGGGRGGGRGRGRGYR